ADPACGAPAVRRAGTPARTWRPGRSRQAKLGPDLLGGDVLARFLQRLPGGGGISELLQPLPRPIGRPAPPQRGEPGGDNGGQALSVLCEVDNMPARSVMRGGADVRSVIERQLAHGLRVCLRTCWRTFTHLRLPHS